MMSYKISFQTYLWSVTMLTLVIEVSLEDVHYVSRRLDGFELITNRVKNFLQCENLCAGRSLCKSVNYNTVTRECTSNYHDLLTSQAPLTTDVTGVVFAEKRSMSQDGGVCDNSPCGDRAVCVQLGSEKKCLTKDLVDCGVLDVPNGWFQFGSTILGSKASIECDEYFRFFGSSRTAECEVTRLWKGINGKCSQVEWRNQVSEFTAPVPAPITRGWKMILNGTPKNNKHFNVVLVESQKPRCHFMLDARFNWLGETNKLLFTSKTGSQWIEEPRLSLPFREQTPFKLSIQRLENVFKIVLDEHFLYNFTVKAATEVIDQFACGGDVTIQVLKFIY